MSDWWCAARRPADCGRPKSPTSWDCRSLSAMRPEPMLAEKLERGGLRLLARSPLATAARQVLAVLEDSPKPAQERAA